MRKTFLILAFGLVLVFEPSLAAPKKSVKQKLQEDSDLSQVRETTINGASARRALCFHLPVLRLSRSNNIFFSTPVVQFERKFLLFH